MWSCKGECLRDSKTLRRTSNKHVESVGQRILTETPYHFPGSAITVKSPKTSWNETTNDTRHMCDIHVCPSWPWCGCHWGTICLPCAAISKHTPAALHFHSPIIQKHPLGWLFTLGHRLAVNIKIMLKFRQICGCKLPGRTWGCPLGALCLSVSHQEGNQFQ